MRRSAPGFRAYRGARQLLALVLPALALMLAARPSHAVEYTQVKTVEGCKVVEVRGYAAAYQQISWSGSCRNGLAEGTGKLVHTWKDGRVNTAWETLQAGRRPFETSDVYSYLENAKTYIHFKQAGQPAVKITEAECLAAPGCWTIAKARGQTNGTSAPKTASAPLSGAAVAVSSGTSAMGIEFRFENRQGSPMIVGTGGPCATSDLGLYRVEASPASLMAREKGGRSIFLETRDSRSSAKRRRACRSTTSGMNSRPATSRQCCAPPQPTRARRKPGRTTSRCNALPATTFSMSKPSTAGSRPTGNPARNAARSVRLFMPGDMR